MRRSRLAHWEWVAILAILLIAWWARVWQPVDLPPGLAAVSDVDTEVLSALAELGYSIVEAQAAIQSIPRDTPNDVEERLRIALSYFAR